MNNKIIVFFILFFFSCNSDYTPKPKAFFKLNLPQKEYSILEANCPFLFKFPIYSNVVFEENSCFMNLVFTEQDAVLYLSYFHLNNNLESHTKRANELAYHYNLKATNIKEKLYNNDSLSVYGVLYDYHGITAASTQFYLTDSLNHFFRGALYFNKEITDSILPTNLFLKYDIKYLIESFRWRGM